MYTKKKKKKDNLVKVRWWKWWENILESSKCIMNDDYVRFNSSVKIILCTNVKSNNEKESKTN